MKNKIYALLIIMFWSTACSLDEKLYDTVSVSAIKDERGVENLVGGMYGYISSNAGYKCVMNILQDCSADIMSVYNVSGVGTKLTISQKNYDASSIEISGTWTAYYRVISTANQILESIESIPLSDEAYNKFRGQALFMRGFCYFNLVRFFGEVPMYLDVTDINSDFHKAKSSVAEVYNVILKDFTEASLLLKTRSQQASSEFSHATKGAAQSYAALAYLTYGNMREFDGENAEDQYELAAIYADSVIKSGQYSLMNNFADLWDYKKESQIYASEAIFGFSYTVDPSVTGKPSKGSELANLYSPSYEINVAGNTSTGRGWGHIRVQPWFYDFAHEGDYTNDYRSDVTFKTRFSYLGTDKIALTYPETYPFYGSLGDNGGQPMPYIKKYVSDTSKANNDPNDLFMMRLAEVYLIKAEALNELSSTPSTEAVDAFNKVRERTRKADGTQRLTPADLDASQLTKDQFRLKIFHERGIEFIGEGHRWFDLVRMKAPASSNVTTMYEYMIKFINQNYQRGLPARTLAGSNTIRWGEGRFDPLTIPETFNKKLLIFPIPLSELSVNPKLKQNTEYGW